MSTTRNCKDIIEIMNIRDVLKYITYDTHLILDLDNTVMEPLALIAGSDQWFTEVIKRAHEQNAPMSSVIKIYDAVQRQIAMQAVESNIVNIIKFTQDIFPVIALTARGEELQETTRQQLQEMGIEFEYIIFCGGKDKGEYLERYYAFCADERPAHVLVVDDKEKHLVHVKEKMDLLGISVTALRYGYLDEKVKQVDMQAAKVELTAMKDRFSTSTQKIMQQLGLMADVVVNDCGSHLDNSLSTATQNSETRASLLPPVEEGSGMRVLNMTPSR